MTVRVLALESNTTTLEDHRLGLAVFTYPSGEVTGQSGIRPGGADLSSDTNMVATIAPFTAIIQGGSTNQGVYSFVSDDDVDLTFDAGEAGTARIDRVIARIYDDTYDASGFVQGQVEYLKGQSNGSASSVPTSSILLWEISVPAGASAGGTPINFSNAVDKRPFTAANGGILPVPTGTERDALTNLYDGKFVYRRDRDWIEYYNGSAWKTPSVPIVSSFANLSLIPNPSTGDAAVVSSTGNVYMRYGGAWELLTEGPSNPRPGESIFRGRSSSTITFSDGSAEFIPWNTEDWDKLGIHSTSSNPSRITPNVAGLYTFSGGIAFSASSVGIRVSYWAKNGSSITGSQINLGAGASGTATIIPARTITVEMNGTTDYVQLLGQSNGVTVSHVNTTGTHQSHVDVTYAGPLP